MLGEDSAMKSQQQMTFGDKKGQRTLAETVGSSRIL